MIDFSNLRNNFKHVLEFASLHEVETMLRCLADRLDAAHPVIAYELREHADTLQQFRVGTVPKHPGPLAHAPGCWFDREHIGPCNRAGVSEHAADCVLASDHSGLCETRPR